MGPAVGIVGNAKALLQLRAQIDRSLKDQDTYPLDDALYRDNNEHEYEVVVRRAKSRAEMEPPPGPSKREKAAEPLPWAERGSGRGGSAPGEPRKGVGGPEAVARRGMRADARGAVPAQLAQASRFAE